jgi:hypothetical protein
MASSPACAEGPSKADAARAAELKKQGDELVHTSHFREALEAYEGSYALVPDPAILYNRGRALQQLGDFPAALEMLEKFAAGAPAELKARVPNLAKMIGDIGAQVATVVINCPVEGAMVMVRGKSVGTTPLASPIRVSVGEASIDVMAPGYAPFRRDAQLQAGSTTVDIALEKQKDAPTVATTKAPPAEVPPTEPPNDEPPRTSSGRGWKIAAFGAGAVGIAGVATGDADAQCPNKVCVPAGRAALNDAQTFASVSTALVIVGAVGIAASVTLFVVSPRSAPATQARLILSPGFSGIGGTW